MAKKRLGLVHLYTGDGKGKTTAAMGLALRAVGQGFRVYVVQFMKGGAYTGELIAGNNFLPNIDMIQYGKNCIKEQKQMKLLGLDSDYHFFDYVRDDIDCGECRNCFANDEQQKKFILDAYARSKKIIGSGDYDIVILDEINVALSLGFIDTEKIVKMIMAKPEKTELVLTGRNAPKELHKYADYVTNMSLVKHPFQKGITARRGIEY